MEALRFGREIDRVQSQPRQTLVVLRREIKLEPAPAFAAQTHVAAPGVEQQVQLLRGQFGVGDV